MSVAVLASEVCRHLVLRISGGEPLPGAIVAAMREHGMSSGWLRASGVLADVELRAYDTELGTLGSTRRIAGPVHVLALEGSVGQSGGEPAFSMRAVLARETELGLVTLAGEIASARAVGLEILLTALDDVTLERSLDAAAGVWLLSSLAPGTRAPAAPASPPDASGAWSTALEASAHADHVGAARPHADAMAGAPSARPRNAGSPGMGAGISATSGAPGAPIPPRPARPGPDLDSPSPEPGDVVDHFAFGPSDVIRSDGDRLHLRVRKDGRVREIALEMLRVSTLGDTEDGKRRFKLERRI